MANALSRTRSAFASTLIIAGLFAALAASAGSSARAADGSADQLTIAEIRAAFSVPDEGNMRFGAPTVDLQDGNRAVVAIDVTMTGAGGTQKTSHLAVVLVGLPAPGATGFMDYTDDACMERIAGTAGQAVTDGTSNTIMFAEVARTSPTLSAQAAAVRACAAIGRAFSAYIGLRLHAPSADTVLHQGADVIQRSPAGTRAPSTSVFSGDAYDNEMGITSQALR